jgi:hypothetical protein
MNKQKKRVNEAISASASSPFSYIVLIDAINCISKNRGYIKTIFASVDLEMLKSWFKKLFSSDAYKANEEKLQAISSRFAGHPQLKGLFITLDKIKSMPFLEAEREQHEKDIQRLIEKISLFIKRRLTDEDIQVLESLTSEINHVSEKITQKLDDDISSVMTVEEPAPKPKEDEEKPKTEIKVNERIKSKLRKKIKEIIRTHLITSKYR